ncbi:hypothetical protein O3M35_011255 [Rhynocoris fuscipes]|uniref:Galactokinase n=1 Tax=Rhynocoris fuscipes TaxID=488301 RepID=A0AAW1CUF8_9HEMI
MECEKKCFMSNLLDYALDTYRSHFQKLPDFAAFAPGRVNLIGEHTDYNNGFVLPIALPLGTIIAGAKNGSSQVHIVSTSSQIGEKNFVIFNLPERGKVEKEPIKWVNYVKGVIAFFEGVVTEGFNAVVVSSVPVGGGLSSSAALEVSTYVFLEAIFQYHNSSLKEKALRCQKAEQLYADMPCGIMDQFISIMAEYGKALLLDCRSLKTTVVPFKTVEEVVVITNSNVQIELSSTEYSLRRKQCEEAAYLLGVESLRDVDLKTLEEYKTKLPIVIYKRARHVVTENARTVAAADALKNNDFITFGKLMIESHNSLRDDFEVSCRELNQLVDIAISVDGVYGSRMTGAGFGGCTVSLAEYMMVLMQ